MVVKHGRTMYVIDEPMSNMGVVLRVLNPPFTTFKVWFNRQIAKGHQHVRSCMEEVNGGRFLFRKWFLRAIWKGKCCQGKEGREERSVRLVSTQGDRSRNVDQQSCRSTDQDGQAATGRRVYRGGRARRAHILLWQCRSTHLFHVRR